jgi:nucleotide-binding universal stress UspA family protein
VRESIVVGTDAGAAPMAVLDWVTRRAEHSEVAIELVVVDDDSAVPFGVGRRDFAGRRSAGLDAAESYLRDHPGIVSITRTILVGDPVRELADAARGADILVIGAPPAGRNGWPRRSLAAQLAARTQCALVVVPSDYHRGGGTIVVGIAADESSDTALAFAAREAERTGHDLLLVHAWALPSPFPIVESANPAHYPSLEAVHRGYLNRALERARVLAPQTNLTTRLQFGPAGHVLARAAVAADLVVVGARDCGWLAEIAVQSVGRAVIHANTCPTVVVPGLPLREPSGSPVRSDMAVR